jgi:GAF domain-containing protein
MVVVQDVARDSRFSRNPFLLEKGIRFYAGAPLRTGSGFVLGSLCIIDSKPRQFPKKDQKLLQVIADELMAKIEAECRRNDLVHQEAQRPKEPAPNLASDHGNGLDATSALGTA